MENSLRLLNTLNGSMTPNSLPRKQVLRSCSWNSTTIKSPPLLRWIAMSSMCICHKTFTSTRSSSTHFLRVPLRASSIGRIRKMLPRFVRAPTNSDLSIPCHYYHCNPKSFPVLGRITLSLLYSPCEHTQKGNHLGRKVALPSILPLILAQRQEKDMVWINHHNAVFNDIFARFKKNVHRFC